MHRSPPHQQRATLIRILHKQFDDPRLPARYRRLRRAAIANVYREIARQYLVRGASVAAIKELGRAALIDPLAMARPARWARLLQTVRAQTSRGRQTNQPPP